ncbi:YggS family pyridoxal phosphate-dependent enzyme [Sansalvadorimonas sp. 2012CJ34-2]|uniref:Pyridoxal phosphate homeostasis protein n=1 Tax=Parendozoicomonas callyspongiae TaxID=2942213 RepID=A0ABT0PAP1_9GAMM|nr:YggS family pyridoxal phosphate-dependent enzyme [Sansalvadorimonas sp. 2012CJ34-2]MCL6268457.1 YggS family pyridoxal phosphate-dependent enzyme [Sansalvadorimonas sp. 2012CJ34-2]
MTSIQKRFQDTLNSIHTAAENCGRHGEVKLLAVSKTKPSEMIREAWQCGQRDFGENYVQEGVNKVNELKDLEGIVWHFIGPLQSNKTRLVTEHFDWMHSVDRVKIAHRLSDQRPADMAPLQICLQVNIDSQPTKSGFKPEEVSKAVEEIIKIPGVEVRGLMAIPAPSEDLEEQRKPFKAMKALLTQLQTENPQLKLDTLSMGMTGDMIAAIEEGATIVRIGTALFGARDYSQPRK